MSASYHCTHFCLLDIIENKNLKAFRYVKTVTYMQKVLFPIMSIASGYINAHFSVNIARY